MYVKNSTGATVVLNNVRLEPGDVAAYDDQLEHDPHFMQFIETQQLRIVEDGPATVDINGPLPPPDAPRKIKKAKP